MSAVLERPERIGAEREENAPVMPERPAGPAGPGRPRRRVSPPVLAWRQFRRAPVTVYFLAAVWAAGLGSGAIAHGPPQRGQRAAEHEPDTQQPGQRPDGGVAGQGAEPRLARQPGQPGQRGGQQHPGGLGGQQRRDRAGATHPALGRGQDQQA